MKPKPSSPSALIAFETCGRRFYETRIAKNFADDAGPAAEYGTAVHFSLENYGRSNTPIPAEHKRYQPAADKILSLPGDKLFEQKVGIRADFSPCAFNDPDVWHRCIIDVLIINGTDALVVDWKTGKKKSDMTQLNLNALVAFAHFPDVQTLALAYYWLTQGPSMTTLNVNRKDLPDLWSRLLPRLKALDHAYATDRWLANPSGLCRKHCPVTTCQFHGGK
jgi:PD-(D/E)XK nuclease superfamily